MSIVMDFRFEPRRATQAAAHLVQLAGGCLNHTKAIKLLYLADRRSLRETGSMMTGDDAVNMTNGPVLSAVYDLVKGRKQSALWASSLRKDGYDLVATGDAGDGELSDYDVALLDALFAEHKSRDWRAMIDFVHELPEWADPGEGAATGLSYEAMLMGAGANQSKIKAYAELNASLRTMDEKRVIRD